MSTVLGEEPSLSIFIGLKMNINTRGNMQRALRPSRDLREFSFSLFVFLYKK